MIIRFKIDATVSFGGDQLEPIPTAALCKSCQLKRLFDLEKPARRPAILKGRCSICGKIVR